MTLYIRSFKWFIGTLYSILCSELLTLDEVSWLTQNISSDILLALYLTVSLDRLFVYIHRFCVGIDRFLGHPPSSNNPAPDWCTVHDFMKKRFKKSYISFQNFVLNCKCAVTLNSIWIEGTYKSFERPYLG